jgi:hypothetical protein
LRTAKVCASAATLTRSAPLVSSSEVRHFAAGAFRDFAAPRGMQRHQAARGRGFLWWRLTFKTIVRIDLRRSLVLVRYG